MRSPTRTLSALALAGLVGLSGCTSDPEAAPSGSDGSPTSSDSPTAALAAAVEAGPFQTARSTYRLDGLAIPGLPVPVEVEGHVVAPVGGAAATAPDSPGGTPPASAQAPLVLFLHGYQASCWSAAEASTTTDWPCPDGFEPIPNAEGFDLLQQRLASQGYMTVSISANGVNVQATDRSADSGARERAALVHRHLAAWASGEVSGPEGAPSADPRAVLLVGHSRGGEGVDRAVADAPDVAAWAVRGEVLLAPTAFGPPERSTVPVVAVTGTCDGDVGLRPGQVYVDRPAAPELVRTAILIDGANHNFFNAQWDPQTSPVPGGYDDAFDESGTADSRCQPEAPQRLSVAAQQEVGARIVGLAAAAFLRGDASSADALDGRIAVPLTGDEQVWVSALGRGRTTLVLDEDYAARGRIATPCDGVSETDDGGACGANTGVGAAPHWPEAHLADEVRRSLELRWETPGDGALLSLHQPLDLSSAAGVEARIAIGGETAPLSMDVRLTDAAGGSVTLPAQDTLIALPEGDLIPVRRWGQRLSAPLRPADGIDLSRVTRIDLIPTTAPGRAWIIDVSALPARQ